MARSASMVLTASGQTMEKLSMEKRHFLSQFSLTIIGILATLISFSQPPTVEWERIFGGDSTDIAYSVQQTFDGGYIYAGETKSFWSFYKDALVVRTDSMGFVDWYHLYGGTGTEIAYSVLQTTDGNFIVAGFTTSFGAGSGDMHLAKLDGVGDTLWARTYGGPHVDRAHAAELTDDGGLILGGITRDSSEVDGIYLVRIDSEGDTLWTRAYVSSHDINIWSIQQTYDGGFVLAGDIEINLFSDYDYFLAKTDSMGDTLWTRTYGGPNEDFGRSVQQTNDAGYIVAGTTWSFGAGYADVYLVKTDSGGDTLWTRTYGGISSESAYSVLVTPEGDYVTAGSTSSSTENADLYLIKTDAEGDTLWTLIYGGQDIEYAYSLAPTDDGSYVVAGAYEIFEPPYYYWVDCLLVKTGPDTSSTHAPSIEWVSHPKDFVLHPAYPNPFNPVTTISFDVPFQSKISMNMYNVLGQRVAVLMDGNVTPGAHQVQWDASDSPSGIYFVSMNAGELVQLRKVVLLK